MGRNINFSCYCEQIEVANIPENYDNSDSQPTEKLLKEMIQELENIQQHRFQQLTQDIERLQSEKTHLLADIDQLRNQRQQQLVQQQQIVENLAQTLVSELQRIMVQQLPQITNTTVHTLNDVSSNVATNSQRSDSNDNIYQVFASLDSSVRTAFQSLQQDLNSYQSSLAQQLNNMHSLEQQGEAILESLINRMRIQLPSETPPPISPSISPPSMVNFTNLQSPLETPLPEISEMSNGNRNGNVRILIDTPPSKTPTIEKPSPPEISTSIELEEKPSPPPRIPVKPPSPQGSQAQLGLILVLISTVALSIHNVVVKIIGSESNVLGLFKFGGFIKFILGNSLLILWLRMIIVLPLMSLVAMTLYPPVWKEIHKFFMSQDKSAFVSVFKALRSSVVGSGFFLFLSQVLIYIAISQIGPGVAVTILFMYPIITVPLAWLFFGDRPTMLRFGVMAMISFGVVLAAIPSITKTGSLNFWGVGAAVISGIAFALYLIFMQISFKKLHPVPVSLIQFSTIFFLTSLSLMLPLPMELSAQVMPGKWFGLLVGAFVLGILTLVGYLLNNFGVRFMGAGKAAIIASSGPVLTSLLAYLIIPGPQTALQFIQIMGILLVTFGVTTLSFERLLSQNKTAKAKG